MQPTPERDAATHRADGHPIGWWKDPGAEVLYGMKETKDGADGDVFRFTLGLVHSIFD